MIPEIANLSSILALVAAVGVLLTGAYGGWRRHSAWVGVASTLSAVQFIAILFAFALLSLSFLQDDFSVLYVANNSTISLPWYYKVSAVWGAHEGSFLFWTLAASGWTVAVAKFPRTLSIDMHGYVLATMGYINTLFLLFLIIASNPFERLVPDVPANGGDLNVILQDFGQIVHPPLLSIGYVGFSVVFAYAIAALLTGKFDAAWARWSRPWTNTAWAFLTVGIALGSWWAYYELGWGGWWFWDPVENASFMPWLVGTALLHSLAVSEQRGMFKAWTVFLALVAFSLSLMGGFLVRSGVLTSVHAFAIDPHRGMFLLAIFALVVIPALTLFLFRATALRSRVRYSGMSRELLLLVNNAVLVACMVIVLIYTLYPLFYEWISGGDRQSIGPPYFNRVFVPLMLGLTIFLVFAPFSRWKHTPLDQLRRCLPLLGIAFVIVFVAVLLFAYTWHWTAIAVTVLAVWMVSTHIAEIYRRRRRFNLSFIGMSAAHIGFGITIIGMAITTGYSATKDVRLGVGDSVYLDDRRFEMTELKPVEDHNYAGFQATIVTDGVVLHPQRRNYFTREMTTSEAGIDPGFTRDVFVTLGEPYPDGTWGVRVQEKPLVRWIWLGALLMALAGILAILDVRYRRLSVRDTQLALAST